jgi:hypothetical protein
VIACVRSEALWRLVDERRKRYGLSWDEIGAWLGGWALPVPWQSEIPLDEARAILQRLARGYVATAGVAAATHTQRRAEGQMQHYDHRIRGPRL